MTTISIALATHNGERFLRDQLDSLAAQSRRPDELVVADDRSTDRTTAIIEDFAARAPFRTVIIPSRRHIGYRASFMRCAERCTGEFIAFCDQDSVWDREKLDSVLRAVNASTLLVQHDFRVADAEGRARPGSIHELGMADGGRWARVLGLTQVFRRELLRFWPFWALSIDHDCPTERMAHDQWVYFLASVLGEVTLLRRTLLTYRRHGMNASGIERRGLPSTSVRPIHALHQAARGRSQSRDAKRDLITNGLKAYQSAAEARAAVLSAVMLHDGVRDHRPRLKDELGFYTRLSSYCARRLSTYESTSGLARLLAMVRAQPGYLSRGREGLEDLLLDAALNV